MWDHVIYFTKAFPHCSARRKLNKVSSSEKCADCCSSFCYQTAIILVNIFVTILHSLAFQELSTSKFSPLFKFSFCLSPLLQIHLITLSFFLRESGFFVLPNCSSVYTISVAFVLFLHVVGGNPIYFSLSLFFLLIWQSINRLGFSHIGPFLYFHKSGIIWTYTFKITCWKLPVLPTSFPLKLTSQISVFAHCLPVCYSALRALFWKAVNSVKFAVILIHVVFSPHSTSEYFPVGWNQSRKTSLSNIFLKFCTEVFSQTHS